MSSIQKQVFLYVDTYKRKKDPASIEALKKTDSDLGIYYIEDDLCVDENNIKILRKTNLDFLKILIRCKMAIFDNINQIYWKKDINEQDILTIINSIKEHYKEGKFFDYDLHNDIFHHFGIVSPIIKFDKTLHEEFIKEEFSKFAPTKKSTREEQCVAFISDRSRLFCLYIFLRRCAILYRDTEYKAPLRLLLDFLSDKTKFKTFKSKHLRVGAFTFFGDDLGTGLHEWLTCQSTIIALRRTAGLSDSENSIKLKAEPCIKPVKTILSIKSGKEEEYIFREFNWLDFQFLVRTETKFIIFPDGLQGHPGAVYGYLVPAEGNEWKGQAPKTKGSTKFHNLINRNFDACKNVHEYMSIILYLYYNMVLHDQSPSFKLSSQPNLLVDRTKTNNARDMIFFQQNKLEDPRKRMFIWHRDMSIHVQLNDLKEGDKFIYLYNSDIEFSNSGFIEKSQAPSLR